MSDYIDFIDSNGNEWTRTTRFREAKETIAAQAAVIEKLRDDFVHIQEYWNGDANEGAMFDALTHIEDVAHEALSTPTDSTQILAEVRRAERERVAQMILNGRFLHDASPAALFAKEVAAAIRAME